MMPPCYPALAAIPLPGWAFVIVMVFCHLAPLGAILFAFWLGERGGQQPNTNSGEKVAK